MIRTFVHLAASVNSGSKRRTKITQIYKKASTVRYLRLELEDALAIPEAIEISQLGPSSRTAQTELSTLCSAAVVATRIAAIRHMCKFKGQTILASAGPRKLVRISATIFEPPAQGMF
ncbi:MAG: hypothetical protein ABJJ37_02945 [Roseibium sp.]